MGAAASFYDPSKAERRRIEIQIDGGSFSKMFDPSGLLVHEGEVVFAYIKDHRFKGDGDMEQMNRLHFSVCSTIIDMRGKGRIDKYVVTNRTDDQYLIEVLAGGWGQQSEEKKSPLYPCKNCLKKVNYSCYAESNWAEKERIRKSFKAKDAMSFLREWFDLFRMEMAGRKSETTYTGYPSNWAAISRAYRRRVGWKCERCCVVLKETSMQSLLDVHHLSGEKSDVSDENLQALCKVCHGEEHSHYPVSDENRRLIMRARRRTNDEKAPSANAPIVDTPDLGLPRRMQWASRVSQAAKNRLFNE